MLYEVITLLMIVIVSFWGATEYSIYPAFQFDNYQFLFGSSVTYQVFLKTFMYTGITWATTLAIGFTIAYFLAFHVRSQTWQTAFFLLCTIPFWTSNIIRMISWIPFLGRDVSGDAPGDAHRLGDDVALDDGGFAEHGGADAVEVAVQLAVELDLARALA